MKKRICLVLIICIFYITNCITASYSEQLVQVYNNEKGLNVLLDQDSIKLTEDGGFITFAYSAYIENDATRKKYDDFYHVNGTQVATYYIIAPKTGVRFAYLSTNIVDNNGRTLFEWNEPNPKNPKMKDMSQQETVQKCFDLAIRTYLDSPDQLTPEEAYRKANSYFNVKDYDNAIKYLKIAAEREYPDALVGLGLMYRQGLGFPIDYVRAMDCFKKADSYGNGNATAECAIGFFYEKGMGVDIDYQTAIDWYKKSAEKNNTTAMKNIAGMYISGIGVTKNLNEGIKWLEKASYLGDKEAGEFLIKVKQVKQQQDNQDAAQAAQFLGIIGSIINNATR